MTMTDRILAARALLADVTPLKGDCGRRCAAACCQGDEDGRGGMLLFPGEEALYSPPPDGAALTDSGLRMPDGRPLWLYTCDGSCHRPNRPLSCRIFPLTPEMDEGGALSIAPDVRAWPVCPLMPFGVQGLSPAFAAAVRAAMALLDEHPDGHAYFALLTEQLNAFRTL